MVPPNRSQHRAFAGAGRLTATREALLSFVGCLHQTGNIRRWITTAEVYKTHMHFRRTTWQCLNTSNACPFVQLRPHQGSVPTGRRAGLCRDMCPRMFAVPLANAGCGAGWEERAGREKGSRGIKERKTAGMSPVEEWLSAQRCSQTPCFSAGVRG